jgi:hypothetical protein
MGSSTTAFNRREFIRTAGCVVGWQAIGPRGRGVSIVTDPSDRVAAAPPAEWAARELERSLEAHGIPVQRCERVAQATRDNFCVFVAGLQPGVAAETLKAARLRVPDDPEALGLVRAPVAGRDVLFACGRDARGLVYALLDLSDRVRNAPDAHEALAIREPVLERPANAVRGVMRLFTSDVEDKPWYNDREMWPQYLTMLATQRFNRFHLSLGLGYDFLRHVTDAYFLFTYPFLLAVPGYRVRVPELPDAERDRNLDMLKFISEQTVLRGMQFQLGLWMHGYEWADSPDANYTILGLTKEIHGPYCRDALRMLLQACPAIGGVTIRIHGESGVEEGSYEFWQTVFAGVASCGRRVEIDMHPKGLDQTMLDIAAATRQPVSVSPKFWAEHLGMPYHQTDIRELEQPQPGVQGTGLMKLSSGSRSFLRYGYGDLLRDDRSWSVIHRVWPGSQRLLLWGDPVTAAAYSRAFGFCGSEGAEICEPLSFKGRRGSGVAGDRCAYADTTLRPRWDWEKYVYGHRVWGRLLYNPDSDPDPWRRYLRAAFGGAATGIESALAHASRILPIVTTAHLPSAANNNYWPEIYTNHSLIDAVRPGPYSDTPVPKVFGNVSPLDPQLFSRINDFADALLSGARSGKYSPIEVARWLDDCADAAMTHLTRAAIRGDAKHRPEYRRLAVDVAIQAGLGRFFAAKFRSGVLYRVHQNTGDRTALEASLTQYRKARDAWADLAGRAKGIYMSDITVGELPQLHGHWLDRLPAMDRDIAALAGVLEGLTHTDPSVAAARAINEVLVPPKRPVPTCRHVPPARFVPGRPLEISLSVETPSSSVALYYRHVNQAERFRSVSMQAREDGYHAAIPAAYTDTVYPLQYYFEMHMTTGNAVLYPGLSPALTGQPYILVRRT